MSSRTGGVAVAVSASTCPAFRPVRRCPSARYAGRKSCPHSELLHLEILVLEEGEQRRDHHRRARQEERGELVAEGLAAARGQDQEDVLAREHRGDGALLLAMEPSNAEALPRQLPDHVRPGALRRLLVSGFERCHLPPLAATAAAFPPESPANLVPGQLERPAARGGDHGPTTNGGPVPSHDS